MKVENYFEDGKIFNPKDVTIALSIIYTYVKKYIKKES